MSIMEMAGKSFPDIRSTTASAQTSSSESSSESDSDCESITWKRKKPIPRSTIEPEVPMKIEAPRSEPCQDVRILKARRNNVWSNVLAEQSLTQGVSMTCSVEGEDIYKCERDVESYSYRKPGLDDADVSQLLQKRKFQKQEFSKGGNGPMKDRLGSHSIVVKRPLMMDFTEDDDEDIVIHGIAKYLQEPKLDLIGRVVKFLGKPKAMELLHLTDEMENMGGILTKDGSRRRTSGGVFLYLLRIDKDVTNSMRKMIFEEERKMNNKLDTHARKRKRNNRKRARMDIDEDSSSLPPLSSGMNQEYENTAQTNTQEDEDIRETMQASSEQNTASVDDRALTTNPEPGQVLPRGSNITAEDDRALTTTPEPGLVLPRGSSQITESDKEDGELSDSD